MIIFEVAWDQCWSGIVFFRYHSGIYNEYFTFFDINRVWVFDGILVFDTIGSVHHAKSPKYQYVLEWDGLK